MLKEKIKGLFLPRKIRFSVASRRIPSTHSLQAVLVVDQKLWEEHKEFLMEFQSSKALKNTNLRIIVMGKCKQIGEMQGVVVLDSKDIAISGKFKSAEIRKMLEENFDFVLVALQHMSQFSALLVASLQAKLKMGMHADKFNVLDVVIHTQNEFLFLEETQRYLQILNKK